MNLLIPISNFRPERMTFRSSWSMPWLRLCEKLYLEPCGGAARDCRASGAHSAAPGYQRLHEQPPSQVPLNIRIHKPHSHESTASAWLFSNDADPVHVRPIRISQAGSGHDYLTAARYYLTSAGNYQKFV